MEMTEEFLVIQFVFPEYFYTKISLKVVPNRASSYLVRCGYPIILECGFAELFLW